MDYSKEENGEYPMLNLFTRPHNLCYLCLRVICLNLNSISTKDDKNTRKLIKGLKLPRFLCEDIINFLYYRRHMRLMSSEIFSIFEDTVNTTLKDVSIDLSYMNEDAMKILCNHKLTSLKIFCCIENSSMYLNFIHNNAFNVESLFIENINEMISVKLQQRKIGHYYWIWPPNTGLRKLRRFLNRRGYVFNMPNLKSLSLPNLDIMSKYYPVLSSRQFKLEHLDLSNISDMSKFEYLDLYPNLVSLVLHNSLNFCNISPYETIEQIVQLKQLKHLDVSFDKYSYSNLYFKNCDEMMDMIIQGLPKLESLDISGTTLTGLSDSTEAIIDGERVTCGIRGLISRVHNPLEFINLSRTNACLRENIPAKIIAGNKTRDQLINLVNYKVDILSPTLILLEFRKLFESTPETNYKVLFSIIVELIEKYEDRVCFLYKIMSMNYVLPYFDVEKIPYNMKRRIIHSCSYGIEFPYVQENELNRLHDFFEILFAPIDLCCLSECEIYVNIFTQPLQSKNSDPRTEFFTLEKLKNFICKLNDTTKYLIVKQTNLIDLLLQFLKSINSSDFLIDQSKDFNYKKFKSALICLYSLVYKVLNNNKIFVEKNGLKFCSKWIKDNSCNVELLITILNIINDIIKNVAIPNLLQHNDIINFIKLINSTEYCQVKYLVINILTELLSDNKCKIKKKLHNQIINVIIRAVKSWEGFSPENVKFTSVEWINELLKVNTTLNCNLN